MVLALKHIIKYKFVIRILFSAFIFYGLGGILQVKYCLSHWMDEDTCRWHHLYLANSCFLNSPEHSSVFKTEWYYFFLQFWPSYSSIITGCSKVSANIRDRGGIAEKKSLFRESHRFKFIISNLIRGGQRRVQRWQEREREMGWINGVTGKSKRVRC